MTKEQLRAYRDIKLERDHLAAMREELEAALYGPGSSRTDGMPRGGSGEKDDKTDILLDRKDKVLKEYKAKEAELAEALLKIEAAIETLEHRERTLIRLYYARGLTWEQVCVAMSYSWRQVHRIHSKALEKLKTEKAQE